MLTFIPETFTGLKGLVCIRCPNIRVIPSTLVNLIELGCDEKPFLEKPSDPIYRNNVHKLIILQRWFKKIILANRIIRLAKSEGFIISWWDPISKGGYLAKKDITKYLEEQKQ